MNDADLFADALALPRAERAAFLDRVCGGDSQKRARMEDLLAANDEAQDFMESPAAPLLPAERSERLRHRSNGEAG